jgi:DNA repair protein RadC
MDTASQQLKNLKNILSKAAYSDIMEHIDHNQPIASLIQGYKSGRFQGAQYARLYAMMQFVADVNVSRKQSARIDSPNTAAMHLMPELAWSPKEKFAVVVMDVKHLILATEIISVGTSTECCADPKEIVGVVLKHKGVRMIVAHNHPSGSLEPSPEDIQLTRQLLKAGKFMALPVLDHLIIGNGDYISMREGTGLWSEFPQE